MNLAEETLLTPVGRMRLITDEDGFVRAADFEGERFERLLARHCGAAARLLVRTSPSEARRALEAFFEGDIERIATLRTRTAGTEFQRQVWAALRAIPGGQTRSYGEIAATIGRPGAMRAVGLANGDNPIALVVPCHRVIGASGSLVGYGGGLERKRWLLDHEREAVRQANRIGSSGAPRAELSPSRHQPTSRQAPSLNPTSA
ncbi:MAG: methylated-DNA--[protein]-cysteine S-methyltransferase [Caulobacteraceae bacterium]